MCGSLRRFVRVLCLIISLNLSRRSSNAECFSVNSNTARARCADVFVCILHACFMKTFAFRASTTRINYVYTISESARSQHVRPGVRSSAITISLIDRSRDHITHDTRTHTHTHGLSHYKTIHIPRTLLSTQPNYAP